MGFSNLIRNQVLASASNYTNGRKGYKVCKITPHHMAGVLSGEQCARLFQNSNRNASANYCIGNDGGIVGCVDENNRAWTSSSSSNDCQAITIEVSNNKIGGDWTISDAAWNSLVNLCVDICKRYNFKLVYDGTPNGSLTRHNMFANTTCPGTYLQGRFQELADTVNARLNANTTPVTNNTSNSNTNSYLVKVTTDALNIRSGAGTSNAVVGCIRDRGTYTIVETQGNWGKLKSGAGWICLDYTTKLNNGSVQSTTNANPTFKVGQKVTLKPSASKYCTGQTIPSSIKNKKYTIMQVGSGKTHPTGVLLKEIMSWVYKTDVQ